MKTKFLSLAFCLLASISVAQQRAADGVTINDEGNPQYSTFSLCAIDPAGVTAPRRPPHSMTLR